MTSSRSAPSRMREFMKEQGILISGQGSIRLVTHLDVDRADIDRFVRRREGVFVCSGEGGVTKGSV